MLSQVRHYDLCSRDNFRLSPMYTHHAVCIDLLLETQTLSLSLRCHVALFIASFMLYHVVAYAMITSVEILCTTLPHSPKTS